MASVEQDLQRERDLIHNALQHQAVAAVVQRASQAGRAPSKLSDALRLHTTGDTRADDPPSLREFQRRKSIKNRERTLANCSASGFNRVSAAGPVVPNQLKQVMSSYWVTGSFIKNPSVGEDVVDAFELLAQLLLEKAARLDHRSSQSVPLFAIHRGLLDEQDRLAVRQRLLNLGPDCGKRGVQVIGGSNWILKQLTDLDSHRLRCDEELERLQRIRQELRHPVGLRA